MSRDDVEMQREGSDEEWDGGPLLSVHQYRFEKHNSGFQNMENQSQNFTHKDSSE